MKGLDASFPSLSKVAIHGKCKKFCKVIQENIARVQQKTDFRGGMGGWGSLLTQILK